jgi:hypothetical protein
MLKNIKLKIERLFISNNKGIKNFIKMIVNYIVIQFIAIGFVYKVELSNIAFSPETKNFEFRLFNEQDIKIIQKNYEKEFDKNKYLKFLTELNTQKIDSYIVKNGNDICGYFFLAYGKSESEIEKKYFNVEKNGYLFNDYVFEKYRGKKIHQFSIYRRLMILKEKKYDTATCLIQHDNIFSIRAYEKFGFQRYLMKYFFRFRNLIRSREYYKLIKV